MKMSWEFSWSSLFLNNRGAVDLFKGYPSNAEEDVEEEDDDSDD